MSIKDKMKACFVMKHRTTTSRRMDCNLPPKTNLKLHRIQNIVFEMVCFATTILFRLLHTLLIFFMLKCVNCTQYIWYRLLALPYLREQFSLELLEACFGYHSETLPLKHYLKLFYCTFELNV